MSTEVKIMKLLKLFYLRRAKRIVVELPNNPVKLAFVMKLEAALNLFSENFQIDVLLKIRNPRANKSKINCY